MAEQVSTAGHGPSRGYSGMNRKLDEYLDSHPDHKGEKASRSRSLGPQPTDFKRRPASEEAARTLLVHLEEAQRKVAQAIQTVREGLALYGEIRKT